MRLYLSDTEYATKSFFDLLNYEKIKLKSLRNDLSNKKKTIEFFYNDFKTYDLSEDSNDIVLQHKFNQFSKYSQEANIQNLENEISAIENSIINQNISYEIISMSILQIAKQGISKIHQQLINCPNGRTIGNNQTLKNIIWQSRNQSIHYEEGNYNNNVKNCFNDLKNDFGNDFDINTSKNLSYKVLESVLEWKTYQDYFDDMILLE